MTGKTKQRLFTFFNIYYAPPPNRPAHQEEKKKKKKRNQASLLLLPPLRLHLLALALALACSALLLTLLLLLLLLVLMLVLVLLVLLVEPGPQGRQDAPPHPDLDGAAAQGARPLGPLGPLHGEEDRTRPHPVAVAVVVVVVVTTVAEVCQSRSLKFTRPRPSLAAPTRSSRPRRSRLITRSEKANPAAVATLLETKEFYRDMTTL